VYKNKQLDFVSPLMKLRCGLWLQDFYMWLDVATGTQSVYHCLYTACRRGCGGEFRCWRHLARLPLLPQQLPTDKELLVAPGAWMGSDEKNPSAVLECDMCLS
jgi:hypothetical protein